jgi:hypothetical protein
MGPLLTHASSRVCRYRDAADVAEMIETYPQYFLTPDFKLVPFMIFEKDNSHGVQDLSCRFAFTVLALLYDLDYLCIGSQEAGYSMLNTVESMNGALSRRLNGAPFTLDLPAPDAASPSELRAAEKLVLKEICRRANGATYSTGGGHINVVESRSTLLASGFEFRPTEMAAYVEAAKAGQGGAFLANTLKSMDGYSGDYAQLLARAWRVLHAPGVTQCTKTSAHAFHFYKNVLNPDCLPRRGPACFFDFLDLFGGTIPQPKRSVLRPFVDAKTDPGHYMDMAERCSSTGRGATGVDEFYPRTLLDAKLEDATLSLIDAFLEGDNMLPAATRDDLCKEMCVDEKMLYADLTERIAKAEYPSTDPTPRDPTPQDPTPRDPTRHLPLPLAGTRASTRPSWTSRSATALCPSSPSSPPPRSPAPSTRSRPTRRHRGRAWPSSRRRRRSSRSSTTRRRSVRRSSPPSMRTGSRCPPSARMRSARRRLRHMQGSRSWRCAQLPLRRRPLPPPKLRRRSQRCWRATRLSPSPQRSSRRRLSMPGTGARWHRRRPRDRIDASAVYSTWRARTAGPRARLGPRVVGVVYALCCVRAMMCVSGARGCGTNSRDANGVLLLHKKIAQIG